MAFYIIALLIVVFSVMVVVVRNPLVSALWLVAVLFVQAALFVLLKAHLVASLQVLLYAGAVMVLILFVIMMLNMGPAKNKWRALTGERLILGTGAFYLLATLGMVIWTIFKTGGEAVSAETVAGTVEATGRLLLTKYVVPFELLSVLLLAAILCAIVASKRRSS